MQEETTKGPEGRFGYGPVVHAISLCLLLAGMWLAFSGHYTPLILSFGVFSVALCIFLTMRMDLIDHEGVPVHLGLSAVGYWAWLLKEIVKANLDVSRRVLQREPDISPVMFSASTSQRTDVGQVTYANSITLTPGTVTLAIDDDEVVVHALDARFAKGVQEGEMDARVRRLEPDS